MSSDSCNLATRHCIPCEGGTPKLPEEEVKRLLNLVDGWLERDNGIEKEFQFKNYYQTMAFVNAVAWIAHNEDHHPDLSVSYRNCRVRYATHAVDGLTENDFICASKVDGLIAAK